MQSPLTFCTTKAKFISFPSNNNIDLAGITGRYHKHKSEKSMIF